MTPTPPPGPAGPSPRNRAADRKRDADRDFGSPRNRDARHLAVAIGVAAVLWFYMFSPWTAGLTNFWLSMSVSAVILTSFTAIAFAGHSDPAKTNACHSEPAKTNACHSEPAKRVKESIFQLLCGIALAFLLWGIFWIGDKASAWLFDFARPEVDAVYAMKEGLPAWLIALLLLVLIGPAEELFWRGYVQRTLGRLFASRSASPSSAASASTAPASDPAATGSASAADAVGAHARNAAELRAQNAAFVVTTAIYALVHIWSFNFMLVMAALVAGAVWGLIYRLCPRALPALVVSHALWDALVFVCLPI